MPVLKTLDNIVPISDFNKGKSTQAFNKSTNGNPVFVVKRNVPEHVILTLDDYRAAQQAKEDLALLALAVERWSEFDGKTTYTAVDLMHKYDISQEGVDAAPDPEFE